MRAATPAEVRSWDALVAANPDGGQYLQTRAWGEVKSRWGWQPHHMVHDGADSEIAVLFLGRRFPGLGDLWYAPKGPGATSSASLLEIVPWQPAPRGAFAVKIEPEVTSGGDVVADLSGAGLVKSPGEIQSSRATIIVDLRPDEDRLLASFKPKTRYNIRLAARSGVIVVDAAPDSVHSNVLYRLLVQTNRRNGIETRRRDYFFDAWSTLAASDHGRCFFAVLHGEVLAGAFVTHLAGRGWYKDGGSTRRHHQLMAPYILQWEIMRWLRGRGVTSYDLVAVPRPSEMTPEHPFAGLQRFKSGFNQHVTEYVGAWDWPVKPLGLRAWNAGGERLARQWSARIYRDFYY